MLTTAERALLFRACWDHPVARCARCGGSFSTGELAANVIGGLDSLCPSCRIDLTQSIRDHLIACAVAASLDSQNVCAEAKTLVETTTWLRKEARRLRDAAAVARAEAEAALSTHKRSQNPPLPKT